MAENDGTQQQQQQNGQQQQQQAKPWFDGIDAETRGHWDNKGWKYQDDPKPLVTELTKAWKNLEQHFGVPAERLIKLPKDATDEAGLKAMRARLGVPAEPKEYDFSAVKFADGTELEAGFTDRMRAALHKAGVPKDVGPEIVKEVVGYLGDADKAELAERTAKVQTERAQLQKEWGTNYEFNRLTAMQGAKRLGVDEATVQKLENEVGFAKIMEMFRKVGAGTSEDTFQDNALVNGIPTTKAGAIARRAELMKDSAWCERYLSGDTAAKAEMNNLLQVITGEGAA